MSLKFFFLLTFIIFAFTQSDNPQPNQQQPQGTNSQPNRQQNSNNNQQVQPNIQEGPKSQPSNPSVPPIQSPPVVVSEIQTGQPNPASGSTQPQKPQTIQPNIIDPIVVEPQTKSPQTKEVKSEQSNNNNPQNVEQQKTQEPNYQKNSGDQHQTNMGQVNQPSREASAADYQTPDPQRSARYKAQQQRLRQMEERQRQANYTAQTIKFSVTQQTKNRQRQQARELKAKFSLTVPNKNVMFEIEHNIEQFILDPISDGQIRISMNIYTLENNAYGVIRDIEKARPLQVYVYQNDNFIVGQAQFYFEKIITIQGKGHSRYTIRFYNEGVQKLVILTYTPMLEKNQLQNIYSNQKSKQHIWKAQYLGYRIQEVTEKLRMNSMMDKTNNEIMINSIRKYSGYQFLEMIVVIGIAGFQVHFIKKLFKNDSIL